MAIKARGERLIGDSDRIVRRRQALVRSNAAAQEKGRGNRKQRAERDRGRRMASNRNKSDSVCHCDRGPNLP